MNKILEFQSFYGMGLWNHSTNSMPKGINPAPKSTSSTNIAEEQKKNRELLLWEGNWGEKRLQKHVGWLKSDLLQPNPNALKFQGVQVPRNSFPAVPPSIWFGVFFVAGTFLITIIDANCSLHFQIPQARLGRIQEQENNDEIQAAPSYLSFIFLNFWYLMT